MNQNASVSLERLQKVIAKAGVASRRKAELLILEGAVTVNGHTVTELGTKVNPHKDKIKVNGKLIYTEVENVYLAFYKPKAVISAMSDPEGRDNLANYLSGISVRVNPIGRLDYNSEGLVLLTNDGELAEQIVKSRELSKAYLLKIKGHPSASDLEFLKKGIFTKEGVMRFSGYELEEFLKNKSWIKLHVTEGSKLDLRELLNRRGIMVDKIIRHSIGHITIKEMKPGEHRMLNKKEFQKLLQIDDKKTTGRFTVGGLKSRKPKKSTKSLDEKKKSLTTAGSSAARRLKPPRAGTKTTNKKKWY